MLVLRSVTLTTTTPVGTVVLPGQLAGGPGEHGRARHIVIVYFHSQDQEGRARLTS